MRNINDKTIRILISKTLKEHKMYLRADTSSDFHMNMRELDNTLTFIREQRKNSLDLITKYFNKESSLAYLSIVTIGALSLAINQQDVHKGPLPEDWASDNKFNPNEILSNLFVQITNYLCSVITLVENGLDSAARLILRPLFELISIALIISESNEQMIKYREGINEKTSTSVWRDNFRIKHLNERLCQLESKLGLPSHLVQYFCKFRSESYRFYSSISHGAYYSCQLGSYAFPFEKDKDYKLGLFGMGSFASYGTLNHLNELNYYFLLMIVSVFNKIHNFKAKTDNELWRMVISLRECVIKTNILIKEIQENGNDFTRNIT
ncbi:DUF5677 domain-containing protein [Brevibacillus centrosporus]|uniref:DUF5677 domain-containing protein n=1 Tax=Brevibacillus centrosporus TaxID=54910 RepID=UPI002E1A3F04|nr:DUF5677 domain-containing protein [Brevibacillus centrosporus]